MPLPPCPARFAARKAAILAQLAQPDDAYADASPKGAVDAGVRPLLAVINGLEGFVTTSSCAGRVAVFVEGRRRRREEAAVAGAGAATVDSERAATAATATTATTASSGGKGGGGTWLFVSHDPLVASAADDDDDDDDDGADVPPLRAYQARDWATELGLAAAGGGGGSGGGGAGVLDEPSPRLVHFKFEPMILHVLTASLAHAQLLLRCAAAAGFRESGAVSICPSGSASSSTSSGNDDAEATALPIVAVRSMGLGFSSVVGMARDVRDGNDVAAAAAVECVVSPAYLAQMVRVADERFAVNRQRTERFRSAVVAAMAQEEEEEAGERRGGSSSSSTWEDAEARRARKRAEGLRQQAAVRAQRAGTGTDEAEPGEEDEEEDEAVLVAGLGM